MSYLSRQDENPYTKFIVDNQDAVRQVLIGLVDIAAYWVKIQIESYLNDLYIRNRMYRS
jgi:hypothetical protein